MSEVVRNYTWGGNPSRRRRDLRRRGKGLAKFMLPLMLVLLALALWLTRDNYDRESFIPADASVEIYVHDVVEKVSEKLSSRVFTLVPESTGARRIIDALKEELPAPEWLLNNLSDDVCHIYGTGFESMDEMVVTTHMTRIGGIAERLMRLSSSGQEDFAGGLNLRYVPDAGVYYAVRGRTLLFSLSRERLIRALTLHPEETLTADQFNEGIRKAAGADIFCSVDATAWSLEAKPFERLDIAFRIEPDAARVSVQGNLSPAFIEQYAPFLKNLMPRKLPAPFDSMVAISADFGVPFVEMLVKLGNGFPAVASFAEFLTVSSDETVMASTVEDAQTLFKEALSLAGARTRIGWFGMESYEMLPAPLLAATFESGTDGVLALFERIVPSTTVNSDVDLTLRLDEEHLMAYTPIIGGASFEPTVASYAGGLLFSTSATLARELVESTQLVQTYSEEGNLYIELRPQPVATACYDAAHELALSGLLRDYNEQTLQEAAKPVLAVAAAVDRIAVFASSDKGALQVNMKIGMSAVAEAAPEAESQTQKMNE